MGVDDDCLFREVGRQWAWGNNGPWLYFQRRVTEREQAHVTKGRVRPATCENTAVLDSLGRFNKAPSTGGLSNRRSFLTVLPAGKSYIKVLAHSVPGKGCLSSWLWWQPCHRLPRQWGERAVACPSSCGDTNPNTGRILATSSNPGCTSKSHWSLGLWHVNLWTYRRWGHGTTSSWLRGLSAQVSIWTEKPKKIAPELDLYRVPLGDTGKGTVYSLQRRVEWCHFPEEWGSQTQARSRLCHGSCGGRRQRSVLAPCLGEGGEGSPLQKPVENTALGQTPGRPRGEAAVCLPRGGSRQKVSPKLQKDGRLRHACIAPGVENLLCRLS